MPRTVDTTLQQDLVIPVQLLQAAHQPVDRRSFRSRVPVLLQVQVMDDLADADDRRLAKVEPLRQRSAWMRFPYMAGRIQSRFRLACIRSNC